MKIVFVVDSVNNLISKVNLMKSKFGNDILFVVKGHFLNIFETFGLKANAVYNKNLTVIMHMLLSKSDIEPVIIYYSSMDIDEELLTKFATAIGTQNNVVNIEPKYNAFEKMCNYSYNIYVKAMFKVKDSMSTPKLQFLPAPFVQELLESHLGNKLFEVMPDRVKTLHFDDKKKNDSMKIKTGFNKLSLIPIIIALALTMILIVTLAFFEINFIAVLIFVCLYILDIIMAIIYQCKIYFDSRFLQ